MALERQMHFEDGEHNVHAPFLEFVWRTNKIEKPVLWTDYFNGFFAANADKII